MRLSSIWELIIPFHHSNKKQSFNKDGPNHQQKSFSKVSFEFLKRHFLWKKWVHTHLILNGLCSSSHLSVFLRWKLYTFLVRVRKKIANSNVRFSNKAIWVLMQLVITSMKQPGFRFLRLRWKLYPFLVRVQKKLANNNVRF